MAIAVLTHKPLSYFSRRLLEEANKEGVNCQIVDFKNTVILIKDGKISLKAFENGVKVILSRPKTTLNSLMLYAMFLTKTLEEEGFYVLNSFQGYLNTLDKVITYRNLSLNKIPIPDSVISPSGRMFDEMNPPFFLKPTYGSRGRGIMFIEDFRDLSFAEGRSVWIAQSSVREENWDLRVVVLGGRVIAVMKRTSEKPVTNISQGGVGSFFEANEEVKELAIKASNALKCEFAGIDISIKGGNAFILDVNSQPDFKGVEESLKINIARELIRHVCSEANRN
ncbi:MAG: RimK family alpha-L-glutamate ligase [Crenarchaeota archaeon]|nr:RimK family alpha-L-glutamate ligase [Thermoproteota archaeon]MDW8034199.1 RimK family alpha-L-glutamate ligase [Nitrososphaerota archaeon]